MPLCVKWSFCPQIGNSLSSTSIIILGKKEKQTILYFVSNILLKPRITGDYYGNLKIDEKNLFG